MVRARDAPRRYRSPVRRLFRTSSSDEPLPTAEVPLNQRTHRIELRVTELRARLNVLFERRDTFWSPDEMRRVLSAGGITPEPNATRAELVVLTRSLAETAAEQWAEEEAAAWAKAQADAAARASEEQKAATHGKFRMRGKQIRLPTFGFAKGGAKPPSQESTMRSSEESSSRSDENEPPASFRARTREPGNTRTAPARPALPEAEEQAEELRRRLRAVLVPDFVENTFWADTVDSLVCSLGKCVTTSCVAHGVAPRSVPRPRRGSVS